MAKTKYKRLTRVRSSGAFVVAVRSRTSLWLGADHLLFVNSSGYTETYKRFYFRDIQTFVVQKTQGATVVNIVLTILLVLFLSPALVVQGIGWKIFLFLISGIFGLFLFVNLLQGQTCRCFLRTAVQTEQLPPLNRIRRTQKILALLRPLIAAAQGGELSLETISEMMRQQPRPSAAGLTGAHNPEIPPVIDS